VKLCPEVHGRVLPASRHTSQDSAAPPHDGGHGLVEPQLVRLPARARLLLVCRHDDRDSAAVFELASDEGRGSGGVRVGEELAEVEERIADLVTIRENLTAALDAGRDDLVACASADCCPIPLVDITTRPTDVSVHSSVGGGR